MYHKRSGCFAVGAGDPDHLHVSCRKTVTNVGQYCFYQVAIRLDLTKKPPRDKCFDESAKVFHVDIVAYLERYGLLVRNCM